MERASGVVRRTVLAAGLSGAVTLAGCLSDPFGSDGPQERTYELTITRSGESLAASVEPAGDVADVVQVNVGDTVVFDVANEAGVAVGLHNHATDGDVVVEADGAHTMTFEATESMTGRHEIEGWVVHDHDGDDGHDGGDGPDGDDGHDDGGGAGNGGHHGEDATQLVVVEVRPRGS